MSLNPKSELMCCTACGRDTTSRSGLCSECSGHVHSSHRGIRFFRIGPSHEDDYSEESGPQVIEREERRFGMHQVRKGEQ